MTALRAGALYTAEHVQAEAIRGVSRRAGRGSENRSATSFLERRTARSSLVTATVVSQSLPLSLLGETRYIRTAEAGTHVGGASMRVTSSLMRGQLTLLTSHSLGRSVRRFKTLEATHQVSTLAVRTFHPPLPTSELYTSPRRYHQLE